MSSYGTSNTGRSKALTTSEETKIQPIAAPVSGEKAPADRPMVFRKRHKRHLSMR
jgi:hypothetical protein